MLDDTFSNIFGKKEIIDTNQRIGLTFGNFDGVHLGHAHLIEKLRSISKGLPIVVVTFDPHPATFFHPENPKPLLMSLDDRVLFLKKNGVDLVVVKKFDEVFSLLTADDFCTKWLKTKFNIQTILLGHDSSYGKNKEGNFAHLKSFASNLNWQVDQLEPLKEKKTGAIISSSAIRHALCNADVEFAETLLGRPYSLSGTVVKGDQVGRQLGFPTANINPNYHYVIPRYGVYTCYVEIHQRKQLYPAVMNCGIRPTVSGKKLQIEAHILNFSEEIYDQEVTFHIKKHIRTEMKFEDISSLKKQICLDVSTASLLFHKEKDLLF